jgi:hypothetical protein
MHRVLLVIFKDPIFWGILCVGILGAVLVM